jgi:hypothetical protein
MLGVIHKWARKHGHDLQNKTQLKYVVQDLSMMVLDFNSVGFFWTISASDEDRDKYMDKKRESLQPGQGREGRKNQYLH